MEPYYHHHITDKSWHTLQNLCRELSFINLLMAGVSIDDDRDLLIRYGKSGWLEELGALLRGRSSVRELGLNDHQYARLRKQQAASLFGP